MSRLRSRRRTLNRKEQLRHRAVTLRQRGFLVLGETHAVRRRERERETKRQTGIQTNIQTERSWVMRGSETLAWRSTGCQGLICRLLVTKQFWMIDSFLYRIGFRRIYRVCQKVVSEFSTLVRCIIFAIFAYLHIIFIKCLISEPSVVSTDGLSSRMVYHHTLRKTRWTTSKRRMFHSSSLRCGLQTALI